MVGEKEMLLVVGKERCCGWSDHEKLRLDPWNVKNKTKIATNANLENRNSIRSL